MAAIPNGDSLGSRVSPGGRALETTSTRQWDVPGAANAFNSFCRECSSRLLINKPKIRRRLWRIWPTAHLDRSPSISSWRTGTFSRNSNLFSYHLAALTTHLVVRFLSLKQVDGPLNLLDSITSTSSAPKELLKVKKENLSVKPYKFWSLPVQITNFLRKRHLKGKAGAKAENLIAAVRKNVDFLKTRSDHLYRALTKNGNGKVALWKLDLYFSHLIIQQSAKTYLFSTQRDIAETVI